MRIKFLFLFLTFLSLNFTVRAQEQESVLIAPDTWEGEIIPFPISFAPEIDFTGFEDLRFAPGWSDSNSQEFWAYSFVWYIDTYGEMTEEKLTEALNLYYDGLMGVTNPNSELQKTESKITQDGDGFKGEMRVYDRFFTKEYMILNIKITESFCTTNKKQIIQCHISPKPFDDSVWEIFKVVKVKPCE